MAVSPRTWRFFARFGTPAIWHPSDHSDDETANVILDAPGQFLADGIVQHTNYTMRYAAEDFVGLDNGEEIEIGDDCFTVREVFAEPNGDGQVMIATLSKVVSE